MKFERWVYKDNRDGSLLVAQTQNWLKAETAHGMELVKHVTGLDEDKLAILYVLSARYNGNDPKFYQELDKLIKE